jgi:hypothetical protein
VIDNNNILLITDNEEVAKAITEKLVLLRSSDNISVTKPNNYKKAIEKSIYSVIFLHELEDNDSTLKLISNIKSLKNSVEIILLLNNCNKEFILKAYDEGIYDYAMVEDEDYELFIKTINCFKHKMQKNINSRNEKFLYQLEVIDSKTKFYKYKYLKDIFIDFSNDLEIQNGYFAILTLDDSIKTKVSTNRLAITIKNSVRGNDIIGVAKGGKFYLILPNIDLAGTKALIEKIQEKMGDVCKIRAGLSRIGINSFDTLDKNAQDSLISATQNNLMFVCITEENQLFQENWLNDENVYPEKKSFKLFNTAFTNKMENVITPVFFRYQKLYETKLTNTKVSQYANNIESVFCLKNDKLQSELTIRYNGYAKFKIEITHSGFDSAENTKIEVPLSSLTDKFLSSLLKQLKDEYKQCAYNKEGE